jgi:hypothetical protein
MPKGLHKPLTRLTRRIRCGSVLVKMIDMLEAPRGEGTG